MKERRSFDCLKGYGDREKVFDLWEGSVALYGSDGRHTDIEFIM